VCVCMYVCVCVMRDVCVPERDRQREYDIMCVMPA